jgi:glycosyltransferase involved in cell wall biosynthesis
MAHPRHNPLALVDPKLSVVIPVYNERATIDEILRRVIETEPRKEIILVDDCSTDGTRQMLEKMLQLQNSGESFAPAMDGADPIPLRDLRIFFQTKNQGKGAALRRGFAEVTGDIILVQDADLEYDPRDYGAMIGPLLDGRADMVYGSRFLSGPHRVMFFWHYVANRAVTLLSDMVNDLNLTDMETGMKGFVREKLMALNLNANRFTFEPEITAKAARARWRIYEVPVSYSGRTYEEGKKIGIRDALTAVCAILYYRFFD